MAVQIGLRYDSIRVLLRSGGRRIGQLYGIVAILGSGGKGLSVNPDFTEIRKMIVRTIVFKVPVNLKAYISGTAAGIKDINDGFNFIQACMIK